MKKKLLLLNFFTLFALASAQNTKDKINTSYCETEKQKGIYNVKCYKAKGDGTTDDTSSVKAAIDAAGSKGGIIYFPEGRYKITASVTISNALILSGTASHTGIIVPDGNFDVFTFTGKDSGSGAKDLKIEGDRHTGGTCITINGANRSRFHNLMITNPHNAFNISKAMTTSIKQTVVTGVKGEYGIRYWGNDTAKSTMLDLDHVKLSGNIDNLNSTGILLDGNVYNTRMNNVVSSVFGTGLWLKKSSGSVRPTLLQADDVEIDSPLKLAMNIEEGENVFFSNLYTYGSEKGDDIIIGENVMNIQMLKGARISTTPREKTSPNLKQ